MSNPSTPFPWKGDARRAGGWLKAKKSEANLRRFSLLPEEGGRSGMSSPSTPFPWKGVDGQGVGRRRKRAKPTSGATRHLLPEEGGRNRMSNPSTPFPWKGDARRAGGWPKAKKSEANLRRYAPPPSRGRRENAAFPASSFRAEARNLFRSRSGKSCEGSGERETPYASCDWGSRCFMQMDLRRKTANGKRKRSLGCARDDETRKRFPPIPFQSRAEANLCPFGAEVGRVKRYSHIRGNQPRLASLVCPFQRKGRE